MFPITPHQDLDKWVTDQRPSQWERMLDSELADKVLTPGCHPAPSHMPGYWNLTGKRRPANRLDIFKYPTMETDQAQSKLGISLFHGPERHRGTCTGVWWEKPLTREGEGRE